MTHKFKYNWTLKDSVFTKDKGKVFSCFACGGGSTMGYKLAGFDVIGCNEIDPRMMEAYTINHKPQYSYLEPIQTFKDRNDLPAELYELDILDGSPPCSSFSTGGVRDRDWGVERKFKEGQATQILDTLFFDLIELADKLKPKVVIAENVKGLMLGKAIKYVREIYAAFDRAGYTVCHYLLDGSKMGVPQRRERVFFVALRKDLAGPFMQRVDMFTMKPALNLDFDEPEIPFGEIEMQDVERRPLIPSYVKYWELANQYGVYDERRNGKCKFGYFRKAMHYLPLATIMSSNTFAIQDRPEMLIDQELGLCSSFPNDYEFADNPPQYLFGMSVPPVMMAQIASRISDQWLSKLQTAHKA